MTEPGRSPALMCPWHTGLDEGLTPAFRRQPFIDGTEGSQDLMEELDALAAEYGNVELVLRRPASLTYTANDPTNGRAVSLQVFDLGGVPDAVRRDFLSELEILRQLRAHPNILRLHRIVGSATPLDLTERVTIVSDRYRGSIVDLLRREGGLEVARSLDIGIKIAGALATCHRATLLHRELKPESILVSQANEPVLGHLGVARLAASARLTMAGQPINTSHVAPEILQGQAATQATDVYGLASSIHQLITGRSPFRTGAGDAPARLFRRILEDPVPPLLGPGVPSGLSELLTAAMAKEPDDRPRSVVALATELQAIQRKNQWSLTPVLVFDLPSCERPEDLAGAEATLPPKLHAPRRPSSRWSLRCRGGHRIERNDRPQRFCRYCGLTLMKECEGGHPSELSAGYCAVCGVPLS